ncbi:85/88 kDa calcium-independent phospholipase A2 [Holothuria leucospilota]|uniref:phospholipase A2 n=1 Tax=Holothuria leucospilota TaxID=206669 RepID=A0A9Q1BPS6_HOLLE|nr:85/88 kDa calcium-independent phospholipase A2 [Holothuria leucospilota]
MDNVLGLWSAIIGTNGRRSEQVTVIERHEVESMTLVATKAGEKLKIFETSDKSCRYYCVLNGGENIPLYRLFQATSKEEALSKLDFISEKLSPFLRLPPFIITEEFLRAVCDSIWEHPMWSAPHIAVESGFMVAFDSDDIASQIDSKQCDNGQTALHLAVKKGNFENIRFLLEAGATPCIPDNCNYTPIHYLVLSPEESREKEEALVLLTRETSDLYKEYNSTEKTVSPLILALKTEKITLARIMVQNKFLVDVGDDEARPIHYAMRQDNLLLIAEILSLSKEQGFARSKKYNATPLHWAKTAGSQQVLLESHSELDTRSNTGDTALHIMVKRQRFECFMGLLLAGAHPDIPDNEGNSPLHTACKLNNVDMVRALVAFNADFEGQNLLKQTPRHCAASHGEKGGAVLQALHLVGAKRCKVQAGDCGHGCLPWGKYDGDVWVKPYDVQDECYEAYAKSFEENINNLLTTLEHMKNVDTLENFRGKREKLLCLDGGGVKGLIEIQLLLAIERASDRKIKQSFDWIAGSRIGGALALFLSHGYCMEDCRRIFCKILYEVYEDTKPYNVEKLEKAAKEFLGEAKMMEVDKPKIMITSTLCNRLTPALHFFRNYIPPSTSSSRITCYSGDYENPPLPPTLEKKWRVLCCALAVPTYYPPIDSFMDGGLIANNPTCDAMAEISEYHLQRKLNGKVPNKLGLVVSLGSGNEPVTGVNDISVYIPKGVTDLYKAAEKVQAATNMVNIMVDLQINETRFRPTDQARAWCDSMGAAFFRLSPPLTEAVALDERNPTKILKVLWQSQVYIYNNKKTLEKIGELINKL